MSAKRLSPDDPIEWLNRARSSLLHSQTEIKGVYLDDLCYDAQQAAEKAIKAILIYQGVRFPYIHDLAELLSLVERSGITLPGDVKQGIRLTRYAVARYPGVMEAVTSAEYKEAVRLAETILQWADSICAPR
jgi:HEPN domain-containing protein